MCGIGAAQTRYVAGAFFEKIRRVAEVMSRAQGLFKVRVEPLRICMDKSPLREIRGGPANRTMVLLNPDFESTLVGCDFGRHVGSHRTNTIFTFRKNAMVQLFNAYFNFSRK